MGAPYIRAIVRKYFMEHPGVHVWLDDLMEALKIQGKNPSTGGVQGAVAQLIDFDMEIFVVERGQCWIYTPGKTPKMEEQREVAPPEQRVRLTSRRLFELVHTTKAGAWILEDEEGEMVIVKPVDM